MKHGGRSYLGILFHFEFNEAFVYTFHPRDQTTAIIIIKKQTETNAWNMCDGCMS